MTAVLINPKKATNPFIEARRQFKTVGEAIDALTEAFDQKADIHGAFILEMAHRRAVANHETRMQEAREIFNILPQQ